MKLFYWLFLLLLPLGCANLNREKYDRTPNGWHVHWEDQGTLVTGIHNKVELYNLFDAAMSRAITECANQMGLSESDVYNRARDYDTLYSLVDNAWFQAVGGGYAGGEVIGRHNVTVAFYSLSSVPNGDPFTAPPWTIHQGVDHPDRTYFGVEVDGEQYPTLGHELTHMNGNLGQ